MKILYVSQRDPRSVSTWSGTARFIWKSLERGGHEVEVGVLPYPWLVRKYNGALDKVTMAFLGGHPHADCDRVVQGAWKFGLRRELGMGGIDLVFGWHPFHVMVGAGLGAPMVFWHDTTFSRTMEAYYPKIAPWWARRGMAMEREALLRCAAVIYPSEWAAEAAVADYGVNREKVHVIPFGANLERAPTAEACGRAIEGRLAAGERRVRFLFVGVEWARKGGDVAVGVVREMRRMGWDARLTVVGTEPVVSGEDGVFVDRMGFIDKRTEEGGRRLTELYLSHDFYLMTSRAESYGIVYSEAMAHALPSLAADVGGVGTMVKNGVTGAIFPWSGDLAEKVAARAAEIRGDTAGYRRLCASSRDAYETRFNWEAAGRDLGGVLEKVVGRK